MFNSLEDLRSQIHTVELDRLEEDIVRIARPMVRMTRTPADDESLPIGASKLGGQPDLPPDFQWKRCNSGENPPDVPGLKSAPFRDTSLTDLQSQYTTNKPLTFIGQFNLAEIAPYDTEHILPDHGLLAFFYDADSIPWGAYDQRDGWQVVHFPDESILVRTSHPTFQGEYGVIEALPAHLVRYETMWSLPQIRLNDDVFYDLSFLQGEGHMTTDTYPRPLEFRAYWDMISAAYKGISPAHHLLGYPMPVQGPIDWECVVESQQIKPNELAERGHMRYSSAQKVEIDVERHKWQFLFQIDSDNSLDVMWGDVGMLYVSIPKASLEARRFEDCWTIMQCS